jgi:hypothetical protein
VTCFFVLLSALNDISDESGGPNATQTRSLEYMNVQSRMRALLTAVASAGQAAVMGPLQSTRKMGSAGMRSAAKSVCYITSKARSSGRRHINLSPQRWASRRRAILLLLLESVQRDSPATWKLLTRNDGADPEHTRFYVEHELVT